MPEMPRFNVLYNIQEEFDGPSPGIEYFRSTPILPPVEEFPIECATIFGLIRQVVKGYLGREGFPEYNDCLESIFGEYAVGEFPNDRTMYCFVGAVEAFTPTLVRQLRNNVLAQFPLWRVMAQYESCQLGIYPSGTWLGNAWIDGDFDADQPAYQDWLRAARAESESKYGSLRRQLLQIGRLIPAAISKASQEQFCVVKAFDRYQPHFPGNAIWILVAGNEGDISLDLNIGAIRTSAVSEAGKIYPPYFPEFWPYTDRKPPFTLLTYLVDRVFGERFAMIDSEGKRIGRFTIEQLANDMMTGHDS